MGYSEASRSPEFVVNIDSNASKQCVGCGDWNFHVNTTASNQSKPHSRDLALSIVALAISQEVMAKKLRELFEYKKIGELLLKSGKGFFEFSAISRACNALVFLHSQIDCLTLAEVPPEKKAPNYSPANWLAWGKHHRAMTLQHLNCMLRVLSKHLNLRVCITSQVFCTTYAFKQLSSGTIPNWKVASSMGHFNGDLLLVQKVYRPTVANMKMTRTPSTTALAGLSINGAITHFPDATIIDSATLQEAQVCIKQFYNTLQRYCQDWAKPVLTLLTRSIANMFQELNTGTQLLFKESLSGLLGLTSSNATAAWSCLRAKEGSHKLCALGLGQDYQNNTAVALPAQGHIPVLGPHAGWLVLSIVFYLYHAACSECIASFPFNNLSRQLLTKSCKCSCGTLSVFY